jgi:hypothetical protein
MSRKKRKEPRSASAAAPLYEHVSPVIASKPLINYFTRLAEGERDGNTGA